MLSVAPVDGAAAAEAARADGGDATDGYAEAARPWRTRRE